MRDAKLGIKKDATHGANDESKHGVDVVAKSDVKLSIKNDATHGANDEAKHGIDMVAK